MAVDIRHRREDVPNHSFPIDHESDAAWDDAQRFLHAKKFANLPALIAEQREAEIVLRGEARVRTDGIVADAENNGASGFKLGAFITEGAGFSRSTRCIVLRVKVNHDRAFGAELAQPNHCSSLVGQFEIRCERPRGELILGGLTQGINSGPVWR